MPFAVIHSSTGGGEQSISVYGPFATVDEACARQDELVNEYIIGVSTSETARARVIDAASVDEFSWSYDGPGRFAPICIRHVEMLP